VVTVRDSHDLYVRARRGQQLRRCT
jgi:hypothetical protein